MKRSNGFWHMTPSPPSPRPKQQQNRNKQKQLQQKQKTQQNNNKQNKNNNNKNNSTDKYNMKTYKLSNDKYIKERHMYVTQTLANVNSQKASKPGFSPQINRIHCTERDLY